MVNGKKLLNSNNKKKEWKNVKMGIMECWNDGRMDRKKLKIMMDYCNKFPSSCHNISLLHCFIIPWSHYSRIPKFHHSIVPRG
jgi:hypothetical protein